MASPAASEVYIIDASDRDHAIEALWREVGFPSLDGKDIAVKANFNSDDPFPATTHPDTLGAIFGQLLDASATSFGIDLHPALQYMEEHVVGSGLINLTGTAFVMFPLKLLVLFPAIYIMQLYRKEANPAFWHLVLLAMIVVGFAPGIRDMVRMVLYV